MHFPPIQPLLLFTCGARNLTDVVKRERGMFKTAAGAVAAMLAQHLGAATRSTPSSKSLSSASLSPSQQQLLAALQVQSVYSSSFVLEIESRASDANTTVRCFLVGQGLCGIHTPAWQLALEGTAEMGTPLVPWGAVALPLQTALEQDYVGRSFCFLPLPAGTGLPIHVNGTFELSSNRRDLWFGSDMAGAGKRRAAWNLALLHDLVGPLYADMLAVAACELGEF
jgi:hypothetical protein